MPHPVFRRAGSRFRPSAKPPAVRIAGGRLRGRDAAHFQYGDAQFLLSGPFRRFQRRPYRFGAPFPRQFADHGTGATVDQLHPRGTRPARRAGPRTDCLGRRRDGSRLFRLPDGDDAVVRTGGIRGRAVSEPVRTHHLRHRAARIPQGDRGDLELLHRIGVQCQPAARRLPCGVPDLAFPVSAFAVDCPSVSADRLFRAAGYLPVCRRSTGAPSPFWCSLLCRR